MPTTNHTFEAAIAATASKATYGGAGTSVFGWLMSNEFAVVMGIVLALGGFAVNWYYKAKEDGRQQHEHDDRMKRLDSK